MKQLTLLKVLTLSALSLASFSTFAMEGDGKHLNKDKLTLEHLTIVANLSGKEFNEVFTLKKSIEEKIEYCFNNLQESIEISCQYKKSLCDLGKFINYGKAQKLSDSRLKGFTYAITVKVYEDNVKSSFVCPNPHGKKDFLEKFKDIKEKTCFYLTLKDFMDKKNWSANYYDTSEKSWKEWNELYGDDN